MAHLEDLKTILERIEARLAERQKKETTAADKKKAPAPEKGDSPILGMFKNLAGQLSGALGLDRLFADVGRSFRPLFTREFAGLLKIVAQPFTAQLATSAKPLDLQKLLEPLSKQLAIKPGAIPDLAKSLEPFIKQLSVSFGRANLPNLGGILAPFVRRVQDMFRVAVPKINLPPFPKIPLPKLPHIVLPDVSKLFTSLAETAKTLIGKIRFPQITLPKLSLPALPKLPDLAKLSDVVKGWFLKFRMPALPKLSLPALPRLALPKLPDLTKLSDGMKGFLKFRLPSLPDLGKLFAPVGGAFRRVASTAGRLTEAFFGGGTGPRGERLPSRLPDVGRAAGTIIRGGTRAVQGIGRALRGEGAGEALEGAGTAARGAAALGEGTAATVAEAGAVEAGAGGLAEAGAGAGVAAGGVAALASNPIGWAVAAGLAVAAVVVALHALPFAVKNFAKSLLDANKEFADASGAMARVFAQQEVRDFLRRKRVGDATAGSAQDLSNALGDLQDDLEDITIGFNWIKNQVGTGIVRAGQGLLDFLKKTSPFFSIPDLIGQVVKNTAPKGEGTFADFLAQQRSREFANNGLRPQQQPIQGHR